MTTKVFIPLCAAIDATLASEADKDLRFALVIWHQKAAEPEYTGSNDESTSRVLRMLEASRERIKEIEIFNDENAGHA